jgi:hypothetical protein
LCLAARKGEECSEGKFGFPLHYDKRYRVNIGIISKNVEDFLRRGKLAGNDKRLSCFRKFLLI